MKFAPERLDLGLGLRPHVVGGDHRAEPLCRADGLQAGHSGAQHQHLGGACRAGRGDEQREEPAERGRPGERRLVAGHVRLGRQRVHPLGPGQRAGEPVEADRGHAPGGQVGGEGGVHQRVQHAEQGLARPQRGDVALVRPADAHHDAGLGQQFVAGHDGSAGLGIGAVAEPGAVARAGLNQDVEPGPAQPRDHLGDERHPALAGRGLFENPYLHGHDLMVSSDVGTSRTGWPASGRVAQAVPSCGSVRT